MLLLKIIFTGPNSSPKPHLKSAQSVCFHFPAKVMLAKLKITFFVTPKLIPSLRVFIILELVIP